MYTLVVQINSLQKSPKQAYTTEINSARRSMCWVFDQTVEIMSDSKALSDTKSLPMQPRHIDSFETPGRCPLLKRSQELKKINILFRSTFTGALMCKHI